MNDARILSLGLIGFSGRMGQSIAKVIEGHASACLAGGLIRHMPSCSSGACEKRPRILTDDAEELFPHCDVLIDFSSASATPLYARVAARHGKPFLSGTTGLNDEAAAVLKECAQNIPVLHTTNTSLSMAVTRRITEMTARLLKDQDYDITITDRHHRWKKDAPSGTALSLGQSVLAGNGGAHEPAYTAVRAGAIVGEHDILFAGQGENITIQHAVTDRRIFAQGAIQAALWLARQSAGFYTMDDVLGKE